jgi:DNA polymerase III sliding clamp (beta) subunit (PCNA family)
MQLTITKQILEVLKAAAKVAKPNSFKPVVEQIVLAFSGYQLQVSATDHAIYYTHTLRLEEEVEEPFVVLISKPFINSLKVKTIAQFSADAYGASGIAYEPLFDIAEFPRDVTAFDTPKQRAANADYFRDFADCAKVASTTKLRPILTGVAHMENVLTATDGHRLLMIEQSDPWEDTLVIPVSVGSLLSQVFGTTGATMTYDSAHVRYESVEAAVTVALLSGQYPDIRRRIIPDWQHKDSAVIMGVAPWITYMDNAIHVHQNAPKKERDPFWGVQLTFSPNHVEFHAKAKQVFTADLTWDSTLEGSQRVNARYLRDALQAVGDHATLYFVPGAQGSLMLRDATNRRTALVLLLHRSREE